MYFFLKCTPAYYRIKANFCIDINDVSIDTVIERNFVYMAKYRFSQIVLHLLFHIDIKLYLGVSRIHMCEHTKMCSLVSCFSAFKIILN